MIPGMKALVMTARRGNAPRGGYEANYPRGEYRGNGGEYRGEGNRSEREGRDYNRMEYNGSGMNNGGVEGRFRDRRGREHYDNGRYAPKRNYGGEMRGYSEGPSNRYESNRGEAEYYGGEGRAEGRYVPPEREMNQIGFRAQRGGEEENEEPQGDEERKERGHGNTINLEQARDERGQQPKKFTEEIAAEWMQKLKNADESSGPRWTMEQAKQIVTQKNLKVNPIEFYATLNMMYSDYSQVAKKLGINVMDLCIGLAAAFLEDKDAKKNKLMNYYEYVVK